MLSNRLGQGHALLKRHVKAERFVSTCANIPSTYIIASASASCPSPRFFAPKPSRSTSSQGTTFHAPHAATSRRTLTSLIKTVPDDLKAVREQFKEEGHKVSYDFANWLAGIVDCSGSFTYKGKGDNLALQITVPSYDKPMLDYAHKHLQSGVLTSRVGGRSLRYTVKSRPHLRAIEMFLQGHLRHSRRIPQYHRNATELQIPLSEPFPLEHSSPWFAGFFSMDGQVDFKIDKKHPEDPGRPQLFVRVNDTDWIDLVPWKKHFGGEILFDTASNGKYHWIIWERKDIENFSAKLNRNYPSAMIKRLEMLDRFYQFRDAKAYQSKSKSNFEWLKFEREWNALVAVVPGTAKDSK